MKHASKHLKVWTVNLWSKVPLLASRTGTGTIVLYEIAALSRPHVRMQEYI